MVFQDDLYLFGLEQCVVGMIFFEFGCQVVFNVSFGIDYGDVVLFFLFGLCISGGVVGLNLVISS